MSILTSRILTFISALVELEPTLPDYDFEFLDAFHKKYYPDQAISQEITAEDFKWILKRYEERWNLIVDTQNDYTFYPEGINTPWVLLARDLEVEFNLSYILILMPTLVNQLEPSRLTPLSQIVDPRNIYRSNNNIWHQQKALGEAILQNNAFCGIIDDPKKKTRYRALTIEECFRIRSKRGNELEVNAGDGMIYASFWDFILRKSTPHWQKYGVCPTQFLSSLLQVVEQYFEVSVGNESVNAFRRNFKLFSQYLATGSLTNINHLYATPIQVDDKRHYLVEILIDCLELKEDLSNKLFAVASWICAVNPSLISESVHLDPIYRDFKAGRYFNLSFLYGLILDLKLNNTDVEYKLYQELLHFIETVLEQDAEGQNFQQEIINKIRVLYRLRWRHVGGACDYFRMPEEYHLAWFRLVQYLAGAGWIERNYYRLLIPTLRHDYDKVTGELVTEYPLSDQILDKKQRQLINLRVSMAHHQINGTFYNCSTELVPIPFSSEEKNRIRYAAPDIYQYYLHVEEKFDDPPLKRETIEQLRKFVNIALIPIGLTAPKVSDAECDAATEAYHSLKAYLNQNLDEKSKLYRQRIKVSGACVTVDELFYGMRSGMCSAGTSKKLAQLIVDYDVVTKFRRRIETEVNIERMRQMSAKKVYSEYSGLSDQEATKRLLTLVVSLFTYKFNYVWHLWWLINSNTVRLDEYTNNLTGTGREIYKILERSIAKGDLQHGRFLYAQIVEHIVSVAIENRSFLRTDDTHNWLMQIKEGSLFHREHVTSFDPELLFIVIWEWLQKNSDNRKLAEFNEQILDKILKILLKPINNYKRWIIINIEFWNFLNHNSMPENVRFELLKELREKEELQVNVVFFAQATKDYIIYRLARMEAKEPVPGNQCFFGVIPNKFKERVEENKLDLENKLILELNLDLEFVAKAEEELIEIPPHQEHNVVEAKDLNINKNIQDVINETIENIHEVIRENENTCIRAYLLEIAPNINLQNESKSVYKVSGA